ncbi:MAG: hypothetical protein JXB88_19440 [Spirochaetales bacterium]|nr:hypothetical protein [Spirochaetales bacterium]
MEIIFCLLVLPFKDTFHVVQVLNDKIEVLSKINIRNRGNNDDLILYAYNERYAAFLEKDRLIIYKILQGNPELIKKIKIIEDLEPSCLSLNDHYLYIGGRWRGKNEERVHFSAGFYNIKEKTPEWNSIPVPGEYIRAGKAIDDILIQPGSFLLVDNLVYPKYLLTYKEIPGEKIELEKVITLAVNGPNERIAKGLLTDRYVAFISTTFGTWDFGYHINIYKTGDYTRIFSIGSSKNSINDFIITGDRLYFILNSFTIGSLEIKDTFFMPIKNDFASMNLYLDKEEDLDTITVKKYPYRIARLVSLPGRTDELMMIYKNNKEYSYYLTDTALSP